MQTQLDVEHAAQKLMGEAMRAFRQAVAAINTSSQAVHIDKDDIEVFFAECFPSIADWNKQIERRGIE